MNDQDLGEKIANYAKIRLCRSVEGYNLPDDYLLSEENRVTIVKMLRAPKAYADVCLSEENDRLIEDNKRLLTRLKDAVAILIMFSDGDIDPCGQTARETIANFKSVLTART